MRWLLSALISPRNVGLDLIQRPGSCTNLGTLIAPYAQIDWSSRSLVEYKEGSQVFRGRFLLEQTPFGGFFERYQAESWLSLGPLKRSQYDQSLQVAISMPHCAFCSNTSCSRGRRRKFRITSHENAILLSFVLNLFCIEVRELH